MPSTDPDRIHTDRSRAESFGVAAATYDRARPSYPSAFIDNLLLDRRPAVLDVGCGTGKLARLIAGRGASVLGVEMDERMARVARGHGVDVEIGGFESWDSGGRTFDLIVSGQAWHWIDPDRGAAKAVTLLASGGLLALCWNFCTPEPDLRRRLDAAYSRVAPQLVDRSMLTGCGPAVIPPVLAQLRATSRFASVEHRRYAWDADYTGAEWVELIQTHSDHITLPPAQLAELVEAVGTAIGDDVVRAHYVTEAIFARTPRLGAPPDHADIELIAIPDAARALGLPASRVNDWIRDGLLLSLRDAAGARCVPAAFILDGVVVKGLRGVITLLRDAGYADPEIVTWLFRADASLPGTPVQALRENRGAEVKRRAQVAGY